MPAAPQTLQKVSAAGFAEAAFVFIGALLMQGLLIFVLAGNVESTDAFAAAAGNPLARASWYPFYIGVLILLAMRWRDLTSTLLPALPLVLLLALTCLSQVWSINPDISSRRIVATLFTVMFGVWLALRPSWLGTLRLLGASLAFVAAIHVFTVIVFPATGVDRAIHIGAWKGIASEKNALGGDMARAALLLLALVHLDRAHRLKWLGAFALALALVIGSTSTTAFIAIALPAAAFLMFLLGQRSPAAALVALYACLVTGGGGLAVLTLFPEDVIALLGKDPTLTGRTGIWEAVNSAILSRPWTGYGLGTFWIDPYGPSYAVREDVDWLVPSAHNNWLEIGLALGLPGIALLAITVGWGLIRAAGRVVSQNNPWLFLGLAQLVVFSLSESAIFWHPNALVCCLFVFYSVLAMRRSEAADLTAAPALIQRPGPSLARGS